MSSETYYIIKTNEGHKSAYSLVDGGYIGNLKDTDFLTKQKGIAPQRIDEKTKTCSIGFSEKDQKWYGWSHRAIHGFTIGSKVKMGDCGFVPSNDEEAIAAAKKWWDADYRHILSGEIKVDKDGNRNVVITWAYSHDLPNEKLRGAIEEGTYHLPKTPGRGEWTAKTMDDAKQMAIDFAKSVS